MHIGTSLPTYTVPARYDHRGLAWSLAISYSRIIQVLQQKPLEPGHINISTINCRNVLHYLIQTRSQKQNGWITALSVCHIFFPKEQLTSFLDLLTFLAFQHLYAEGGLTRVILLQRSTLTKNPSPNRPASSRTVLSSESSHSCLNISQ